MDMVADSIKAMESLRHTHRSMGLVGLPDNNGECAVCGLNVRDAIHRRAHEPPEPHVASLGAEWIVNRRMAAHAPA